MKVITPEKLQDLVYIDEVRVSPDGSRAAFVRLSADRSANENVRAIWIKNLRDITAPALPFTAGRKDSAPRWNHDGSRLGFIAARKAEAATKAEAAIYVIAMSGGEAQRVVGHPNGVSAFEWSPDGSRVAFTAPVRVDEQTKEDVERSKLAAGSDEAVKDSWDIKRDKEQRGHSDALRLDPRIVREFPYRAGTTYLEDRWTHIYTADVPASFADEQKVKAERVTSGDTNYSLPTWTQDGTGLIATMARQPEHTTIEYWYDLVRVPTRDAGGQALVTLISNRYNHIHPLTSPDGKWVAFARLNAEQPEFHDEILAVAPAGGGATIDLTLSLDRSVDQFVWGADSRHLYFTVIKDGSTNLYRVSVLDYLIEQLTDLAHDITSFDVDATGRVIFAASTPGDPSALYARDTDGRITALFQPNTRFLTDHHVCPVEEIHYPSDEFTIQGWIITPPDFDPVKKYPLALEIHGGPSAMWGASTRSMWHEWQILAQSGYVVFFCNPRGSGGYGEIFLAANRADWGDGPMRDILRGVDLVAARGVVDTDRMALTGGSYGGYLTAWIIGRDHRFKAAVAQRGVYNLISMRGVTDIPFFNDRESGTTPWDDVAALWRMSPVALAPDVQTPLLLEHSEQDYRVPISQAEELYLALRSFKKVVELIRWPREGHELSRSGEPKHRVERIRRIVQWFDQYTALSPFGIVKS